MDHKNLTINRERSIKETMKRIDEIGLGTIMIVDDDEKICGITTDGDIRRTILRGVDVTEKIKEIMRKDPVFIYENDLNNQDVINERVNKIIERAPPTRFIPLLDNQKKLIKFILLSELKKPYRTESSEYKGVDENSRKVLVVGGAGYLGSILVNKLLEKGYKVRILEIFLFGKESIDEIKNNPHLEIVEGDIRNIQTISDALKGVDAVIDLAAVVGDPACQTKPIDAIETNYLAAKTLAEACKYQQINKFIFASTCSVYGQGEEKLAEESPLNPISLYAKSKIKTEEGILSLSDNNFSPCILRMGTLYGLSPRMRFDLVVNVLTMKALTEKKIEIFGGDQWRPLVHVDDAAEAYIKCLEAPIRKIRGEVFNVGSNEQNYQIKHLGDMIKENIPETVVEITDKEIIQGQGDKRDYIVSFDKIKQILNYSVNKKIKDAILEIKWAIETGKISDAKDKRYYNLQN